MKTSHEPRDPATISTTTFTPPGTLVRRGGHAAARSYARTPRAALSAAAGGGPEKNVGGVGEEWGAWRS